MVEGSQGRTGPLQLKPGVEARVEASRLVGRVVRGGAWSNTALRHLDLPAGDSRLVRHLVYGTLRNLGRLDRAISALSHRPLPTIDHDLLDILRVAFHEALFGRAADHAVADTAVESARSRGYGRAAGFVNALVRNVQRQGEPAPPSNPAERYGLPEWLVEDLVGAWGRPSALAFAEASHRDAALTFRMEAATDPPEGAAPTAIPGAYSWYGGGPPPGAAVLDPASLAVAVAVGIRSGDLVLEVGAAPGGKTLAMWDMGPALLVAVDMHERRIRRAVRRTDRSGFGGAWVRADGRRLPFRPGSFDRVLVDAPCTGFGTLRRRPEIALRAARADRDRLAVLQRRLLEEALAVVRPGGRVVYSVCTVTSAETVGVVSGLGGRSPEGIPGQPIDGGLLMAPHLTGTDGMFISVLRG